MQATTANVGESHIEVPVTYEGPEVKMTLGSQFISDFLRVLDPNKNFSMGLSMNRISAIQNRRCYINVIMPMARDH